MRVPPGATDVTTYFKLVDPTTGAPETALVIANLTMSYTRDRAAAAGVTAATELAAVDTAHTDYYMKQIDATNQPGLYRADWADAAFVAGVAKVQLCIKGAAIDPAVIEVEIDASLGANSYSTFAADSIAVGVIADNAIAAAKIASDAIAAAKIATGAITAAKFGAGAIDAAAIATGAIDADAIADNAIDAGAIAADAITAAKIADGAIDAATFAAGAINAAAIADAAIDNATFAADTIFKNTHAGTASAAGASTITLAAGASTVNDYYAGQIVRIISATAGAGQTRVIKSYAGGTLIATFTHAWATTPTGTIVYVIQPAAVPQLGSDGKVLISADADAAMEARVLCAEHGVAPDHLFYIDPVNGSDSNAGNTRTTAVLSFGKLFNSTNGLVYDSTAGPVVVYVLGDLRTSSGTGGDNTLRRWNYGGLKFIGVNWPRLYTQVAGDNCTLSFIAENTDLSGFRMQGATGNIIDILGHSRLFATTDVDTGANTIAYVAHGLRTGTPCTVESTGTRPAGISGTAGTVYYIGAASVNLIKLYTTSAAAWAGGTEVDITDVGSGSHAICISANNAWIHHNRWDAIGGSTSPGVSIGGVGTSPVTYRPTGTIIEHNTFVPTGSNFATFIYLGLTATTKAIGTIIRHNDFYFASSTFIKADYADGALIHDNNFGRFTGYVYDVTPANVNATTDTFTVTAHGMADNTSVNVITTGTLPGGLSAGTTYYTLSTGADTFTLHTASPAGAGNLVNITSAGTGLHTIGSGWHINITANASRVHCINNRTGSGVLKVQNLSATSYVWNAKTEMDLALNAEIPASPVADSINQRVKAVDDLTQASGGGDLAATKTRVVLALPAVAPDSSGGLATEDASGNINASVQAMANGVVTAAAIATGAVDADAIADNAIDAGAIAADAITAAKVAADVSAEIADAVWDEAIAGHVGAGSTGAKLNTATTLQSVANEGHVHIAQDNTT